MALDLKASAGILNGVRKRTRSEDAMPGDTTLADLEGAATLDPWKLPLDQLDPSEGTLWQRGLLYEYFKRLRREDPVHWSPTGPSGGYWSVTKFNDIVAVDSNHQVFSSDKNIAVGDAPDDFRPTSFITSDPPKHDWQRKAVQPAIAPTRLAEVEDLIRSRTAAVLDTLPVGETFDWVDRVSVELTTQMLATMFDFPWEDRRLLPYWSDMATASEAMGNTVISPAERQRVLMESLAYMTRLWHERAARPPQFDFLSLLAHDPKTKDMVNQPWDFLGNLMLLIVGGNDTTRNSMTGSVLCFDAFPGEWEKVRADRSLIPNMVSEIIRMQSPVAHMRRTATEDTEIGGKHIAKGDRVVMWYCSGNRDDEVIENPDTFIADRPRARHHLSFGFGIHRCMGNRIAEMQLRILWEEAFARFSRIEVMGEAEKAMSNFILGYTRLPVRLHR
ncbi:cytochrome P450 [Zavarzinia sp. CC-PAN008]|uniref:cytochrome P450 n=1 Tax=Zavarzinia sp. CC-PAN008 TaxID=3243332 RepID=UPI003F7455B0